VLFDSLTVEAGKPLETGRPSVFGHIATPCDAGSTHYYMFVSRQDRLDDAALDALISSGQREVIEKEDSPMLQLINDHMDGRDLLDMRPLVLPDDAGALRARRIMKRLLAAT
jgi:vanillate O-demethylase monooxygenase subunit